MKHLFKTLNQSPYVFYILPFFSDPLASLHLYQNLKNQHFIFLDPHPLFKKLQKAGYSVFCLKDQDPSTKITKNSAALLNHPLTLQFIKKTQGRKTPAILYFKPQAKIDHLAKKKGWLTLNNPARLQRKLENKFLLPDLCQKLNIPCPPSILCLLNEKNLKKLSSTFSFPLIIQSAHGWAGNNTFLLTSSQNLKKQPLFNQKVKISQYIPGLTLINNAVATRYQTFQSPPALQFTGLSPLTPTVLGTCGRQWPAPISSSTKKEIVNITQKIGDYLYKNHYRGFFGLDFQLAKDQKLYLLEINPRLTASFSFYTHLELQANISPLLLFHLLEHLDLDYQVNPQKEKRRTNSLKIIGSELSQKLNSSADQKILFSPPSGIYNSKAKLVIPLSVSWTKNLKKTKKKDLYLVTAQTSPQTISVNSEYLKISKLESFYDPRSKKIKISILDLNKQLNAQFQFQKK